MEEFMDDHRVNPGVKLICSELPMAPLAPAREREQGELGFGG
jgi:hypothetical protein